MQSAPISFAICGLHKFINLLMEILITNDDENENVSFQCTYIAHAVVFIQFTSEVQPLLTALQISKYSGVPNGARRSTKYPLYRAE